MNGFTVELKTSYSLARNNCITIELISNREKNKNGWFNMSKAEVFCFYDINNNIFYACLADELRELYFKYKNLYKTKLF